MITSKQILNYAKEQGGYISPKMLRTWAGKGLLPEAKLERPGRSLGTVALYPDGSERQAVAVYMLTRQTRDIEAIKWKLFEVGYPVDIKLYLENALKNHKRVIEQIRSDNFRDSYIDLNEPTVKDYPTFVYLITMLYTSPLDEEIPNEDWRNQDNQLFFGILKNVFPGWKENIDIYDLEDDIRNYLEPENVEEIFSNANENLIRLAYRELWFAMMYLWKLYKQSKAFWEGKGVNDKQAKGIERFDSLGKAWLLLLWLSLRNHPIFSPYINDLSEVIPRHYGE